MPAVIVESSKNDYGISLNSMVVLSFLLHALILSIVFFSPSWSRPQWTFGPTYTVDLVSIPVSAISQKEVTNSLSEKIVDIGTRDHAVIIKKRVNKSSSIQVKKLSSYKKESFTGDVGKAIEGIKQKVATQSKVVKGRRTQAQSNGSGLVSSPSVNEMNMKLQVYYSMIWSRIKDNWILPPGIMLDNNLEAVIGAKILRDGKVTDLVFEKKSGNKYFDDSVMKAARKASPLPPLPEWYNGGNLEVGVRFHPSELR